MRRAILILGVMIGLACGPARAATDPAHGGTAPASTETHAAGEHEAHGPSYGLLTVDGYAMIWTIIVFVLLLLALRLVAWKPILQGLQRREKFILDSLANAKRERQEAENLLKQYTAQIQKAREEASAIVDEGRRDAEAVRKRISEEARAEAHALLERAKRDLAIARDDAIKALYRQSVDLSTMIAGKLVKKQLTPQDHQALIDEALHEIGQLRH
ncbi:MAG: F0F1 ATP synthase subunit B [Phycisphaerae bacterium]|nr:F0F1 ATP synthase subunit B [Phycisphaerae bacterium]